MATLRELEERLLASGRVEGNELRELKQIIYANGKVSRAMADFLVVLHKRVGQRTPSFDQFFYQAIKDHILTDGKINAEETAWLRQMIFRDDRVEDEERKFLNQLKGEAKEVGPEFETLLKEALKAPMERRTSG
jgi:hypothetical protein